MNIIIILGLLMVVGLIIVSLIHQKQQREQLRRLQLRRLRVQIEELSEVLSCVEQTVGDKNLSRKLNGLILGYLNAMRNLEAKPVPYIENALQKAVAHHNELDNPNFIFRVRYERESDAQINKTQQQLVETLNLLSDLTAQGRLAEAEFESFQSQLRWAHLMVAVMSFVAQANKCLAINDRVTAQAFFQRALHQLLESSLPNPKRQGLIREINEMLQGDRLRLSDNLTTTDQGYYADLDAI
jgi:hypothetical protein